MMPPYTDWDEVENRVRTPEFGATYLSTGASEAELPSNQALDQLYQELGYAQPKKWKSVLTAVVVIIALVIAAIIIF